MVRKDDLSLKESAMSELKILKIIYFRNDESLQDQKERNIAGTDRKYSIVPNLFNIEFFIQLKVK